MTREDTHLLARPRVPQPGRLVVTRGHHRFPIRREDHPIHRARRVASEGHQRFASLGVPYTCGAIFAGRGHIRGIGRKDRLAHQPIVTNKLPNLFACGDIPQPRRLVTAGGEYHFAIGGEDGAVEFLGVAGKDAQLLAGGGVPQASGLVGAGREDGIAVGREGGLPHHIVMAEETHDTGGDCGCWRWRRLSCGERRLQVPHAGCAVETAVATRLPSGEKTAPWTASA